MIQEQLILLGCISEITLLKMGWVWHEKFLDCPSSDLVIYYWVTYRIKAYFIISHDPMGDKAQLGWFFCSPEVSHSRGCSWLEDWLHWLV
jgi:hypothetical protein